MPTNYQRGYDTEQRCIRELERVGYTAVRTAGSHGPVDVIAWTPTHTRFIQCKRTKQGGSYNSEREQLRGYPCPPNTTLELWVWDDEYAKTKAGWLSQEVVVAR